MLFIDAVETDPSLNLAMEEHLFFNKTEEIFMLWQNRPSIIIGKNQNALSEIDYDYVKAHDIKVVRRLSGGGAVYHDEGNLNFTYIVNREGFGDYVGFTETFRSFLSSLGLSAEVSGRNDVLVDGKKISGNAQYQHHGRLLHHGTILIGADMTHLSKALKPDPEKIQSKGIASVKSRVVNLSTLCGLDAAAFRKAFADFFLKTEGGEPYHFTEEDMAAAKKLQEEKYNTYAWNFGYSPRYAFTKKTRISGGTVEVHLDIQNGKIMKAGIFGDFLEDGEKIRACILNAEHSEEGIRFALNDVQLSTLDKEQLISCFL